MSEDSTRRLSVSLALEALQEASEDVRRAQVRLEDSRAVRNELILEARDVPVNRLARITGLSREAIYKILGGGDPR